MGKIDEQIRKELADVVRKHENYLMIEGLTAICPDCGRHCCGDEPQEWIFNYDKWQGRTPRDPFGCTKWKSFMRCCQCGRLFVVEDGNCVMLGVE
jgi:hypothetical protein